MSSEDEESVQKTQATTARGYEIASKIERLRNDLAGDVKRLKAFVSNYRLRVGDWRVLFEVDSNTVIVHDVKHRSQA